MAKAKKGGKKKGGSKKGGGKKKMETKMKSLNGCRGGSGHKAF